MATQSQKPQENTKLRDCPDCGQSVSRRASQCIHCGCPLEATQALADSQDSASSKVLHVRDATALRYARRRTSRQSKEILTRVGLVSVLTLLMIIGIFVLVEQTGRENGSDSPATKSKSPSNRRSEKAEEITVDFQPISRASQSVQATLETLGGLDFDEFKSKVGAFKTELRLLKPLVDSRDDKEVLKLCRLLDETYDDMSIVIRNMRGADIAKIELQRQVADLKERAKRLNIDIDTMPALKDDMAVVKLLNAGYIPLSLESGDWSDIANEYDFEIVTAGSKDLKLVKPEILGAIVVVSDAYSEQLTKMAYGQ